MQYPSTRSTIELGDSGDLVALLHQELIENGFSCGSDVESRPPVFGPETLEAVKQFQSCNVGYDGKHLVPDGVVGPRTWVALTSVGGEEVGGALPDMPVQAASNPVAAVALSSAWAEFARGVREEPDGSNRGPRVDLYTGLAGTPLDRVGPSWCAFFTSWNFAKAPGGSPFGRIGGAQAIATYCQKNLPGSVVDVHGLVHPGDLGVIVTGGVHGHVFQVAAVKDSTVWTVEGNSGNAVRTRKRQVSSARWYINFDRYALDRGF
jgi:hypothetical protein